jgi:hypothetical protein
MKKVTLADGKYEFDIDDYGIMVGSRRNGVEWPAGFELRFTNVFMAALQRIIELESKT